MSSIHRISIVNIKPLVFHHSGVRHIHTGMIHNSISLIVGHWQILLFKSQAAIFQSAEPVFEIFVYRTCVDYSIRKAFKTVSIPIIITIHTTFYSFKQALY